MTFHLVTEGRRIFTQVLKSVECENTKEGQEVESSDNHWNRVR